MAGVDFCVEDVACLGLAQQEAIDAPSEQLVTYVLLDGKAIVGGNYALFEAELLPGAAVVAKERAHSVKYRPHFVSLFGLSCPHPLSSKCPKCLKIRCSLSSSVAAWCFLILGSKKQGKYLTEIQRVTATCKWHGLAALCMRGTWCCLALCARGVWGQL